jgi:1-acyl-sn-glycerol-3-phosphate acyltransferase
LIRSILAAAWILLATPPLSLAIVLGTFVNAPVSFHDRIARFWIRSILRVSGVEVHSVGLEHVSDARPQLLLANHTSHFDVLAVADTVPTRYRFIGKIELSRVPLWGRAWQAAGHIAIDRSDTQRAVSSLARAAELARSDGSSIVIFPEGTRSADGRLQPFKKGAFMLALQSGIEIVPVAVRGSRDILPKGSWRPQAGRIIVRFGPPIDTTGYTERTRDDLMARVRAQLDTLLDEARPST